MASTSLTASGIDFSDHQTLGSPIVSTISEVFDHYEEGTNTMTFRFGGVSGASQGDGTMQYRRVGSIVHFDVYIGIASTVSGGGGHAYVTGLPFTVGTGMSTVTYTNDRINDFEFLTARSTGTSFAVYKHPTSNSENLTNFNDGNWAAGVAGKGIGIAGMYFI